MSTPILGWFTLLKGESFGPKSNSPFLKGKWMVNMVNHPSRVNEGSTTLAENPLHFSRKPSCTLIIFGWNQPAITTDMFLLKILKL